MHHRPTKLLFNNTRRSLGAYSHSADDDYEYDDEDIELIFIIKKRIFQSSYRVVSLKYIPDDTIATIYHQTKQQFIHKGVYDGFMNIK